MGNLDICTQHGVVVKSHSGYSNGKEPFSRHLCFCGGGLLQGSPTRGKVVEIFAWDHVERTGSKPWKLETTTWSHHLRGIWIVFCRALFHNHIFLFWFDVCICIYVLGLSRTNTGKPIFLFRAASTPQQEAGLIMEKLWSTSGRRPWGDEGFRILNVSAAQLMDPVFLAGDWIASIYYSCHMSCQVRLHRLWQRVHTLSVTQLHVKMSRAQQWVLLWVLYSSGDLNILNSIHQCRHHGSMANLLSAQGWCLRHCMDEPFSFYCWTCPLRHHEIDWWLASLSCSWSCQTIKSPGVERMGERLKACRTLARSLGFFGGNEWATDWSRCICVQ